VFAAIGSHSTKWHRDCGVPAKEADVGVEGTNEPIFARTALWNFLVKVGFNSYLCALKISDLQLNLNFFKFIQK
jgi:hypothetical protein